MATKIFSTAIVLRKKDENESDRIFFAFTKQCGYLEIFAKSIRKSESKLRSGIEALSISEIEFVQGKNKKTLTDAVFTKKFLNISSSLKKSEAVAKISNCLDVFVRGQEKDEKVFELLRESLEKLNELSLKDEKSIFAYYYFLWNALCLLGYDLQAQKCASCGLKLSPSGVYFSAKAGGIICENCALKEKNIIQIDSNTVKILRIILAKDWQTLFKLKIGQKEDELLLKISDNLINYYK